MRCRLLALVLALPSATLVSAGVPAFFAPAEPSGRLLVRLYPMENVTPGTSRLVTFGVPFPRGSVTPAALAKVRVLGGGNEVPAHVENQTPWRHATNPAIDGQSVRVARIQIHHTFAVSYPSFESVEVEWGLSDRQQNVPAIESPRNGWHPVTSGTFVAADGVSEPDVYAVLSRAVLSKGVLRPMRTHPGDRSVPDTRSDPAVMDATEHWPDFLEQEHAAKNNLFNLINQDDPAVTAPNQCPYKTAYEPWLYDRASSFFVLYLRTGFLRPLREAVRAAEFYRTQLWPAGTNPPNAVGAFKLKVPDPAGYIGGNGAMYSYDECLAYLHWIAGDEVAAQAIPWIVSAHEANDEPTRWSPSLGGWTERHTAFRLLANAIAYEVTGNTTYRASLLSQAGDFIWHQNGAAGQLPAGRVDGGLYHYGSQHGDGTPNELVASSWMTALTGDAMVRAYAMTEDPAVGHFVRRLGTFERTATKTDGNHPYTYGPLAYPDYMMRWDGASDVRDGSEAEHSLDVASTLAWASYFGELLGPADPTLKQAAEDLYFTYDIGVNHWIRPAGPASGLPAYRVSPWRKYGWEHRASTSLSWLIGDLILKDGFED